SGVDEIYVRTFPGAGAKTRVSSSGGVSPVWRPDGKELFFVSSDGLLMSVSVNLDNEEGFKPGRPQPLFPAGIDTNTLLGLTLYDVAADGQRFLVTRALDKTRPSPIHVVVNWRQELERMAMERKKAR
ncbi:MAG: hypothetical protein GY953_07340, partial [bacterium]|nr:hypothetical protein [bacterium]